MKVNADLRLLPKPKVRKLQNEHQYVDHHCVFFSFYSYPVEALNLLLLVLPLFAQGQQLILQVANLLLQLCGLGVETLFLTLKHQDQNTQL